MALKVNLLPKEELEKRPLGKVLKWMLSYGRYIVISVELVVLLVLFSRFIFDRRLADLNDSIEQKQAIVIAAKDLENSIRTYQDRIKQIKELEGKRSSYGKLIDKLKEVTPKEISYKSISIDENVLSLSGSALTNVSFARLLSTLKNDTDFSQIEIQELRKQKDTAILDFTATINIAHEAS